MYRLGSSKRERRISVEKGSSIRELFRLYYSLNPPVIEPSSIARREFAFQFFESESYVRHISFSDYASLMRFLAEKGPRHAYYSVALYELPEAPKMEEKGWLGSEVLVDIDVDHIEGCEAIVPGDECIAKGFNAAMKAKRIIERDFGVKAEVYFTGNRGFHILFSCDWCLKLGKEERREIARYLSAEDLDPRFIFPEERGRGKRKIKPAPPRSEDPGWRGWLAREAATGNWRPGDPIPPGIGVPVDHQVTQDPTRLSRLRYSINGKGGMIVAPVETEFIMDKRLSPFRGEIEIRALKDVEAVILGVEVSLKQGDIEPLPAYTAVTLWIRGLVEPLKGDIIVRADTGWRPL